MDVDDSSTSIETVAATPIPSCSSENNDCRINCTDHESLCSIVNVILAQISELSDSCDSNEGRADFISRFNDTFKNALQENIVINGLPWMMNKNKLTSSQKEDHEQMVDDALLAKLGKTVSDVAHKRKFCPEQCCRILNINMKHEIQNLKKAKVVDDSTPSKESFVTFKRSSKAKHFTKFCREFRSLQEDIQYMVKKRREIEMQMNFASQIQSNQSIADKSCWKKN